MSHDRSSTKRFIHLGSRGTNAVLQFNVPRHGLPYSSGEEEQSSISEIEYHMTDPLQGFPSVFGVEEQTVLFSSMFLPHFHVFRERRNNHIIH